MYWGNRMCISEVAEQPCGQKMAVEAGQNYLRELF